MTRTPLPKNRATPMVLSQYARNVLATMAEEPRALEDVNPGLKHRLEERGLVEVANIRHPRRKVEGPHLCLTAAGRAEVARLRQANQLSR